MSIEIIIAGLTTAIITAFFLGYSVSKQVIGLRYTLAPNPNGTWKERLKRRITLFLTFFTSIIGLALCGIIAIIIAAHVQIVII